MTGDASLRATPTMRDVARRAGVSQATVSYVINGRGRAASRISDETRSRVYAAMDELRYVPNDPARHLRRRRTDRICLVVSRVGSPYVEALIEDVERVATTNGYSLAIALGGSREREVRIFDQMRQRMADGLIVEGAFSSRADFRDLATAGIPVVAVGSDLEPDGFDVVSPFEDDAILAACTSLANSGHRRVAVLHHTPGVVSPDRRPMRILKALKQVGIEVPERLRLYGAESRSHAYQAVREILQQPSPPTALFSASDIGAISAIWAAHSLKRTIPDDFAIVGSGNIAEGEITQPSLSTIGTEHQPFDAIPAMLIRRLTGEERGGGQQLLIPWQFYRRNSS